MAAPRGRATRLALALALALGAPLGALSAPPPPPPKTAGLRGVRAIVANASAEDLERSLDSLLASIRLGADAALLRRVGSIEAAMARTFQALPRNEFGRLPPHGVRHVVRTYFATVSGWLIRGLEPGGMQVDTKHLHDVNILSERAPALLETLLEARSAGWGLSMESIAALVVLVERLILEESVQVLESAYEVTGFDVRQPLREQDLHTVLATYLIMHEHGHAAHEVNESAIGELLEQVHTFDDPPCLADMENDAVYNSLFDKRYAASPFGQKPQDFGFEDASRLARYLTRAYGKEQNIQCGLMKDHLVQLDRSGQGLVPLGSFYAQDPSMSYSFAESTEYLSKIGALEQPAQRAPSVRIANYVLGPSNCIASSAYFATCCFDECATLMGELEGRVKAPAASPERLLGLVSRMSSSSVDAPRRLSGSLSGRLHSIAAENGGEVPLHGRLFAQWMHRAFPHECAHPHVAEDVKVLTTSHWEDQDFYSTSDEMEAYVRLAAEGGLTDDAAPLTWSAGEVLPLQADARTSRWGSVGVGVVRAAAALALGLVVLRLALAGWSAASRAVAGAGAGDHSKPKAQPLPF